MRRGACGEERAAPDTYDNTNAGSSLLVAVQTVAVQTVGAQERDGEAEGEAEGGARGAAQAGSEHEDCEGLDHVGVPAFFLLI